MSNDKDFKKRFDSEYATEWKREVKYLSSLGILPAFVRQSEKSTVLVYRYKKTSALFRALDVFYTQIENERDYQELKRQISKAHREQAEKEVVEYGEDS